MKTRTWNEAKANSDKLTNLISKQLEKNIPNTILDVLNTIKLIDPDCGILPNPNHKGKYCQIILYPSSKWNTWNTTSMSISKYNLFR